MDQHDDVPITHRTRYCVFDKTVEEWLSPTIRRLKERQQKTLENETLHNIMAQLQKYTDRHIWEAVVVEDPHLFASCGHDGVIYISRPLLGYCQSEAELAWMLSHELSHGLARHRWEVAGKLTVYALIAPFIGVVPGTIFTILYGLHLLRQFEFEADEMGIKLMTQAGYEPMAAIISMQRLDALSQDSRQAPSFLHRLRRLPPLRTHPRLTSRIERLERLLPRSTQMPMRCEGVH